MFLFLAVPVLFLATDASACVCSYVFVYVHAGVSSRMHVSTVCEDVAVHGGAESNISDIKSMLLRSLMDIYRLNASTHTHTPAVQAAS